MNSRGTKDQLLIDKLLMLDSQQYHKNLYMVWFDFCKAYDSVLYDWLLEYLNFLEYIKTFVHSLLNPCFFGELRTLTCCRVVLGDVELHRGIFQGDI